MISINPNALCKDEAFVLYENFMGYGTIASSVAVANDGFPENVRGPQTFDGWEPNATSGNVYIQAEQIATRTYDCVTIIGHNLGTVIGAGGFVRVWLRVAGTWTFAAEVIPTNNDDILIILPDTPANGCRVTVDMGAGHTAPTRPFISNIVAGKRLIIPHGARADYSPINLAVDVETRPNQSRGGQFLGTTYNMLGASTSIDLALQERGWIEGPAAPFLRHFNRGDPFIWASCPEFMPDDFAYCWRAGDELVPVYGQGAVWGSMSMSVSAYLGGNRV